MSPKIFKIGRKSELLEVLRDKSSDPFSIKEGHFKFGQLKDNFYYSDWTEQSFLSDTGRKEMVSRTFNFDKIKYFSLVILLALAIIIGRSIWLQVIKNDYYRLLAEGNRLRSETIEPKRGIIYAKDLRPLVRNKANFVLYLRPIDLPKNELIRDDLIRKISAILDSGKDQKNITAVVRASASSSLDLVTDEPSFYQIKESLAKIKMGSLESYQPLFVADSIDYDKAMLISIELPSWPGVFLSSKIRREYLLPSATTTATFLGENSLAHVLGYTGKINDGELSELGKEYSMIDYIGKAGLEYS